MFVTEIKKVTEPGSGFGKRHIQALLLFLSLCIAVSMRSQLSVTIVAMTSDKVIYEDCNRLEVNVSKHVTETTSFNDTEVESVDKNSLVINTKQLCGVESHNVSKLSVYRVSYLL